ncbi:Alcohol dehydrogenase-like [Thalictrum thalictroides]|uniref:Alcohol dehydrogenase-like n=1 Tax=Thalictrum thalictroides TaxID=46969 RepID=A0A7J6V760_THATH|nr:Alcohol dehydrogenase-like [Thalictrum thalictroides]
MILTNPLKHRVVESVGQYVEEVKEGDRVAPVFLANCQECVDCKSEKSNMCTTFPFVNEPVVKISPEIAPDKACLLSCGVSTGIGAAWKVANGSTVAIFGLGAVGVGLGVMAQMSNLTMKQTPKLILTVVTADLHLKHAVSVPLVSHPNLPTSPGI